MRQHYCGWMALLVTLIPCCGIRAASYGPLPLAFEENHGQAGAQVNYLARGQGYGLFLSPGSATLRLVTRCQTAELHMDLVGAGASAIHGLDPLPGTSRYYRGNIAGQWIAEAPSFARVSYRDVYPGVNLVFYGKDQHLEYDFLVAPNANPRAIRLAFAGADRLRIDRGGDLVLRIGGGEVRMLKPAAYQDVAGKRRTISVNYSIRGKQVSFLVGAYDPAQPLVIDPVLTYSSYLGGSGMDGASAVAVDASGNAYFTGWTSSANFPTTIGAPRVTAGGLTDAFVIKIDATGTSRLYSTFLGGSSDDYGKGIALDANGNIYVVGSTQSSDFPTLAPLQSFGGATDAFVAKLSPSGTLVYSTYLGGSGDDDARAVAIDTSNNVYVAGVTDSANFPVTAGGFRTTLAGASDAFVVKLNASGAKLYATYLGGTNSDEATGVAVDGSGDAWVTGSTWSSDFPTANGRQAYGGSLDAFVSKLNPSGTGLLFSTFLGGNSVDRAAAIALDGNGNAYVTGDTGSANFPTTNGGFQTASNGLFPDEDAFVVKYTANGSQVAYATRLGGTGDDAGYGIAVDAAGNANVTGQTTSANFPVLANVRDFGGGVDAFLTTLNSSGSALTFSTWLGGSDNDTGRGITVDANGRAYVAGMTNSANFPVRPQIGAPQIVPGGGIQDGFVAAVQYCDHSASLMGSPFTAAGGNGSLLVTANSGCPWSVSTDVAWITFSSGSTGSGNATVGYSVAPANQETPRSGNISVGNQSFVVSQAACGYVLSPTHAEFGSLASSGAVSITTNGSCQWTASSTATWIHLTSAAGGTGNGQVTYSIDANLSPPPPRSGSLLIGGQIFPILQDGYVSAPMRFVPVTPCRIADTRNPTGPFGGPPLGAGSSRDFVVPSSACGIPSSAAAYSLNVTVVPTGSLGFLSIWPTGQSRPLVSTLNSLDGRIKANAAIVPAGLNGAFTVYATDPTHAIIDINGYFVAASGAQNLAFYPLTPCRVADTRNPTGVFGGLSLAGGAQRTFPVPSSACGIPASAQAYSFNMTVVPTGSLGFLTTWPAGSPQPLVSTLNALTGVITSNAAIVPAGVNGAISVYATDTTDLIIDIDGYFAPPGTGSLDFYTATPCRVLDTRNAAGPLGGPIMGAGQSRSFIVPSSACGIPATARAYSLNATVVPPAPLGYLTLWGSGGMPFVSTLNSPDGMIVANAALVPAGASGAVTAYTTHLSHLILDINGYFQ